MVIEKNIFIKKMEHDYLAKIIVVGDPYVGKSSFSSVVGEDFDPEYMLTIGVDFFAIKKSTKNNRWKMNLWDTAGQETFRSITKTYYRESAICILMFDVTKRYTFLSLEKWFIDVFNENEDTYFVLIGNKIDKDDRVVSKEEAVEWAHSKNIMYFETSVKNKIGIDIFSTILLDFESKNPDLDYKKGIKKNEILVNKSSTSKYSKRTCSKDCEQELDRIEKLCCIII